VEASSSLATAVWLEDTAQIDPVESAVSRRPGCWLSS
jgi:hypothetical protein